MLQADNWKKERKNTPGVKYVLYIIYKVIDSVHKCVSHFQRKNIVGVSLVIYDGEVLLE
jgi:hypothetical protein